MRARFLFILVVAQLAIGCRDTAGPSIGTVAGVYGATTFTSTTNGVCGDFSTDPEPKIRLAGTRLVSGS